MNLSTWRDAAPPTEGRTRLATVPAEAAKNPRRSIVPPPKLRGARALSVHSRPQRQRLFAEHVGQDHVPRLVECHMVDVEQRAAIRQYGFEMAGALRPRPSCGSVRPGDAPERSL